MCALQSLNGLDFESLTQTPPSEMTEAEISNSCASMQKLADDQIVCFHEAGCCKELEEVGAWDQNAAQLACPSFKPLDCENPYSAAAALQAPFLLLAGAALLSSAFLR